MPPVSVLGMKIVTRAWVPMDDTHTLFIMMGPRQRPTPSGQNGAAFEGVALGPTPLLPNSGDWYGRFRAVANASNDYQIDRARQRAGSFTGMEGIHLQDQMITESMGPIVDRSRERLGSSDAMVIQTRQRLLAAARALRLDGTPPPGVDQPAAYGVRAGGVILPRDADWIAATRERRAAFVTHIGLDVEIAGNVPGA
jgi:hypothetical protein